MKIDSRFQARPSLRVQLTLDGEDIYAQAGDTVAAALLAHSGNASRITTNESPRTAYCMMGVCFDCLIEIDGCSNEQGCMTQVRDGMVLRSQSGLRKIDSHLDNEQDDV